MNTGEDLSNSVHDEEYSPKPNDVPFGNSSAMQLLSLPFCFFVLFSVSSRARVNVHNTQRTCNSLLTYWWHSTYDFLGVVATLPPDTFQIEKI